jgi:hypothetical protein
MGGLPVTRYIFLDLTDDDAHIAQALFLISSYGNDNEMMSRVLPFPPRSA